MTADAKAIMEAIDRHARCYADWLYSPAGKGVATISASANARAEVERRVTALVEDADRLNRALVGVVSGDLSCINKDAYREAKIALTAHTDATRSAERVGE